MIEIYTDGSCLENPGNGGWAAIINNNGKIEKMKDPMLPEIVLLGLIFVNFFRLRAFFIFYIFGLVDKKFFFIFIYFFSFIIH